MSRTKFQILAVIIISLSTVSSALANAPVSIAVRALSQKLKNDLAVSSINLKLDKVQSQNISRTQIRVKGTGAANELPINFEVKIDRIKDIPVDVAYVIANPADSVTIAADTEDLLTRNLLNQLSKDYKTERIVISIDGFDTTQSGDAKNFKGTGEIKVGFELSRIDFDVTIDQKTDTPTLVKYKVKE